MTQVTLYTGGGVSLSPLYAEGRTVSNYIRLIADEGKMLTDGVYTTYSVDVLPNDISKWQEVEDDEEDDLSPEEALEILLGEENE